MQDDYSALKLPNKKVGSYLLQLSFPYHYDKLTLFIEK